MGCPAETGIGESLVFSICTHDPDTGVLTDADAAPSYRIYETETATPILNGNMATLDGGNTTGFYTELIACTAGNGFEDGKSYTIYIEATVNSDTGGIAFGFKAIDRVTAAVVNTQVNDVFNVDAKDELSTAPAKDASIGDKITHIDMMVRNGGTHNRNTGVLTINKDDGSALETATVSDTGGAAGTLTRGKVS